MSDRAPAVTQLIAKWRSGSEKAREQLLEQLYPDLRSLAGSKLRSFGGSITLQPTALVNEFVARLLDSETSANDRNHFMALAAVAMRGILVDYARARRRQKRGGDRIRVTLDESALSAAGGSDAADLVDLDQALTRLFALDERKGRAIELQYFGGLNLQEISNVLGVARATVARDLNTAKRWLAVEMEST